MASHLGAKLLIWVEVAGFDEICTYGLPSKLNMTLRHPATVCCQRKPQMNNTLRCSSLSACLGRRQPAMVE